MYVMPVSATGTPYSPRSNSPMECSVSLVPSAPRQSRSMPSTTRLVLVPINVHVPPRMLAKLRGIMTCALGTCMFSAHFWTMGIMTATTGVLLRNALTIAMGSMSRSCAPATVRGRPRSLPMYQSRPPVALIPAATTNRTATVRRPSFANPARPSSTEITPEAIKTPRAPIMTWSGWIRSHRRHPNATITTATVNQPSQGAGDEEEEVEVDMSREREGASAPPRA